MKITYLSEPVQEYVQAIDKAENPEQLVTAIEPFRRIADDAYQRARNMALDDWAEFKRGLQCERQGVFAGEAWMRSFRAILFPGIMFQTSMAAKQYGVPWGTAYLRLRELGIVREGHGRAHFEEPA